MTASIIDQLNIIYRGGMVKRYHNRPVLHTQNNAEHQYMVASIACLLCPNISVQTLKNILWHDIYEYETGDMPWAIKRANPDIKAAIVRIEEISKKKYGLTTDNSHFSHNLLKLSEYIECMIFCINERKTGNKEYNQSFKDCITMIMEHLSSLNEDYTDFINRVHEIVKALKKEWKECQKN